VHGVPAHPGQSASWTLTLPWRSGMVAGQALHGSVGNPVSPFQPIMSGCLRLDVNLTAHGEQRAEGAVRVGDGGIQLSDVALHMEAVGLGDQVAAGANAAGWRAGWQQARLLLGQVERPAARGGDVASVSSTWALSAKLVVQRPV